MNQYETAAMRENKYGKARQTLGAARGWEPWQKWEDGMVRSLVEHGVRSVAILAKRLQRTENAILCRIEKRYGKVTRDEHSYIVRPFRQFEHYGTAHGSTPFTNLPENLPRTVEWSVLNNPYSWDLEPNMSYERSDAKIFYDAVSDVSRAKSNPFFDDARFSYRVTPTEFRAMRRHIEHQHGGVVTSLSILGVDVVPTMPESQAAIKDYEGSG